MVKTPERKVAEYWLAEPERTLEAQSRLLTGYVGLWTASLKRMMGEPAAPVAEPDPRDKRFTDPEWSQNQFFDFIKQFYLITSRWAEEMVERRRRTSTRTPARRPPSTSSRSPTRWRRRISC